MKRRFYIDAIAGVLVALAPWSLYAVSVTPQNAGNSLTNTAGVTTFYYPTSNLITTGGGTTACTQQIGPITVNSGQANPVALNGAAGSNLLTNGVITFSISTSTDLATIAGQPSGSTVGTNDISIRAQASASSGSFVDLPLVLISGGVATNSAGYNGNVTEIAYGNTPGATVTFGIPLRDIVAATDIGNGLAIPAGVAATQTKGFCNAFGSLANDPTTKDGPHFCSPGMGINPSNIILGGGSATLNIGLIAKGGELNNPTLGTPDTTSKGSTSVNLLFTACAPGAGAGTYTQPNYSFTAVPGDQRVKIVNNTAPLTDNIPVVGAVVVADFAGQPITMNSPVVSPSSNVGGGLYTIGGLVNDQQYCFALGYVNAAGWVSTGDAANKSPFVQPNPPVCATPSQIDGFLNRSTCFIASAAYGEEWDPRLETLRQFRDQVLDHFALGRAFTEWYYSWSPQAAHWLFENPGYKAIVRFFLLPVVEGARITLWIRGNMWVFGVALLLGTLAVLLTQWRRTPT